MTRKIDNCQLEVDDARGVVYVHSEGGVTLLRVCQIPPRHFDHLHYDRKARQWYGMIDVVFDRELAKGHTK